MKLIKLFSMSMFMLFAGSAFSQATQEWVDCGLCIFDSDGVCHEIVLGAGHLVENKNKVHLSCHAYSQYAADNFTTAELYDSGCFAGGYFDFEMDNLNVSTPSGQILFNCHIDK